MARTERFQDFPLGPRRAGVPLHRWLYAELRRGIAEGRLKPGMRLPSTRSLAGQHRLARATVVAVFEQLRAEGYLQGRQGSGTIVAAELPDQFFAAPPASGAAGAGTTRARLSQRGAAVARHRYEATPEPHAFSICVPGVDGFPLELWAQMTARRLRLGRGALLGRGDPLGYRPLREAIAAYIGSTRSVRCTSEQVAIVSGTQQAFDYVARLTFDPGDAVWVENPGYHGAVQALEAAGARVVPVRVDASGLDLAAGRRAAPEPRLIYVTPAHQFPLGVTMSLERRLALLDFAERCGAWSFEDDYDGEYRYEVRPIGALQGHDRQGHVIYVGTFNKLMFPALRLGYVVLPPRLVEPFRALRDTTDRHLPTLEQAVLADFLREGHFERHIRRSRARYRERRDTLLDAARTRLDGLLELQNAEAGFQLIGTLRNGLSARVAAERAAAAGLDVTPLGQFYRGGLRPPGEQLLLGFAAVTPAAIRAGIERLAVVLRARRAP